MASCFCGAPAVAFCEKCGAGGVFCEKCADVGHDAHKEWATMPRPPSWLALCKILVGCEGLPKIDHVVRGARTSLPPKFNSGPKFRQPMFVGRRASSLYAVKIGHVGVPEGQLHTCEASSNREVHVCYWVPLKRPRQLITVKTLRT